MEPGKRGFYGCESQGWRKPLELGQLWPRRRTQRQLAGGWVESWGWGSRGGKSGKMASCHATWESGIRMEQGRTKKQSCIPGTHSRSCHTSGLLGCEKTHKPFWVRVFCFLPPDTSSLVPRSTRMSTLRRQESHHLVLSWIPRASNSGWHVWISICWMKYL